MERMKTAERLPFGVINLIPNLKFDEILILEENAHFIPRTFIHVDSVREYPFNDIFSHFIGYTGQISPEELSELRREGYRLRDRIGKAGLERVFDSKLRGRAGYQEIEVGVTGHHRKIISVLPPEPGTDLLLTIDSELQRAAARAFGDRAGSVIAMNPSTGEILVWFSNPGYDPSIFTMPLSREEVAEIFQNPDHPLFNRPIQGQYPPGSVFKIITAAAALSEGISPEKEYRCDGSITVGYDKRVFRCWSDTRHGKLNMKEAIAKSCNVYFYNLALDVGPEAIRKAGEALGLGAPVQNYFSGEVRGSLPSPEWKKTNLGAGWNPGDSVNMGVGQGFVLTTPIQILRAVSMVATGGYIANPSVLKLEVKDGKLLAGHEPDKLKQGEISQEILEIIQEGMEMAAQPGGGGTAAWFNVPVDAAAKTGTAQNPFGDDHAWFAGYAPAKNPEIAIVVMMENAGFGATHAMPVARAVFREYFKEKTL